VILTLIDLIRALGAEASPGGSVASLASAHTMIDLSTQRDDAGRSARLLKHLAVVTQSAPWSMPPIISAAVSIS
jgi:hypothetical protein